MEIITQLPVRCGSIRLFTRRRLQFYNNQRKPIDEENNIWPLFLNVQ